MGTRADFYIGRDTINAEWLGSIAWDGYPDGVFCDTVDDFLNGDYESQEAWRTAVTEYITSRDDGTLPERGWPWPWEDSRTTDYAYAYDTEDGNLYGSCFGRGWFLLEVSETRDNEDGEPVSREKTAIFPNMKGVQNVSFGKNSGILIL